MKIGVRVSRAVWLQLAGMVMLCNCAVKRNNSDHYSSTLDFSENEAAVYATMVNFFHEGAQHDSLLSRGCCYVWVNDSTTNKYQAFAISPYIYNFFNKRKAFDYILKRYLDANEEPYLIPNNMWQNNIAAKEQLHITFSRIGFNDDSTIAMLYAQNYIKSLWGGNGAIYILEYVIDKWEIKRYDYLWLR